MKAIQVLGDPCGCAECYQAGVSDQQTVIDMRTGAELHGYEKKRWYEARDQFLRDFKAWAGVPFEQAGR